MTDLLRVPDAASVADCNQTHARLVTSTRRLAEAAADFERALDRGAQMYELRILDREVLTAEHDHDTAAGAHAQTGCAHPHHRQVADGTRSQATG